jgi:hypothetical protein
MTRPLILFYYSPSVVPVVESGKLVRVVSSYGAPG